MPVLSMIFVAVAVFLVALLAALALGSPACARCGQPLDHPVHFKCDRRKCPWEHHTHLADPTPSLVVVAMLAVDLGAFLVLR